MVKLAEYPRTATFAWSHDKVPLLATGTASGTVDADFSSESTLELWSLLSADVEKPQGSITASAKFNDLDWSPDNSILAGALDNGIVEFFSPKELKSVAKIGKHTTPVNTLKFNAKQDNVLCSGDNRGEIFIWDINKITSSGYAPFSPGVAMTPIDEVYSLAWNQSLAHVFASAGSSGYTSIWDLKAKKEVLHLSYTSPSTGAKNHLSVVEWHPSNSTKIATATGHDNDPVILVWDLRNAKAPLQAMSQGHSKGILSLDWCKQDENLLLSSGRDNTCALWNPQTAQKLSQFPTRGNWCFKTKFAPEAPDLFASASLDNKIQVQTLQNLTNKLDLEDIVSKQQESEADFWNNVSEQGCNEKPTVIKMQAPSWYGNRSAGAQWAFGGKLVSITADGRGVSITKPEIPGLEKNSMLDKALESKNFKPIINKRLVQSINSVNEDDWNLLEKLSLDGRESFLKEALAFDDEDEDEAKSQKQSEDEGEDFFKNLNEKSVPKGSFVMDISEKSSSLTKSLVSGDLKSAVASTLEQDLLLESLIIALDSEDENLRQKVKNVYFSKYVNDSPLTRILYSISEKNVDDLVENVDVSQWKYITKAIYTYTPADVSKRNELLVKLGKRVLDSGNREDALVLYLAAGSLDDVASIWLKEFSGLESQLKSKKGTIYEAHLECLTEFVERFTVFSSFASDGKDGKLANEGLISRFLEFVNLISANGDFDLALKFLDNLPSENEEVKMEKQRVLIASGKSVSLATSNNVAANKASRYAAAANNAPFSVPGIAPSLPVGGSVIPPPNPLAPRVPSSTFVQSSPLASRNASFAAPVAAPSVVPSKSNAYAPPSVGAAANLNKYAPPASVSPVALPIAPIASVPVNPYAPSASGIAAVPTNPYTVPSPGNQFVNTFKPVANPVPAGIPRSGETPIQQPPLSSIASGQTPHLNKKANDGWNDLSLDVKEKQTRAKPVSTAPIGVGVMPGTSGTPSNAGVPPPPLSRVTSSANVIAPPPPPPPKSTSRSASSNGSNPYAPPPISNAHTPVASSPYAPPPATNFAQPAAPNPYAPSAQQLAGTLQGQATANQYAATPLNNGSQVAPPPPKSVVGPPPKSTRRKNHADQDIDSANALLESVQKKPEVSSPAPIPAPIPVSSAPVPATPSPITEPTEEPSKIPEDQQPLIDFLTSELARVTPLIPHEYTKQLKDCNKRLKILFNHLEKQDLLTQPTIDKLHQLVGFLKEHKYSEAMQVHVDIATNHAEEAGNWLTGVKRLIGIAEATSS